MKKTFLLLLLLIINITFSQTKKSLPLISISKTYKIGFSNYDKEFKMYQKPFILKGNKKYKIQGYNIDNYSDGKILSISPNKRYFVLDYISKGYVDDGKNKTLYENYLCVIVDINKRKVAIEMQEDCGGYWNNNNQWINNDKIIFSCKLRRKGSL